MTTTTTRPERTEAAEYYFRYIDQVADGDVISTLEQQLPETLALLNGVSEERSRHRYEPGKWSLRQVLAHVNDTERLFVFRAMWFARGLEQPLPSFDQDVAMAAAGADDRTWRSLVDEFRALREASIEFFRGLPVDAWDGRGVASDNPFTVRALAYMTAGHLIHHVKIIRGRYL